MSKISQLGKIAWWKAKGMSQEEMAKKLMEDPEVQKIFQKIHIGVKIGKIKQNELLKVQTLMSSNPKEAQKKVEELLKRVEDL